MERLENDLSGSLSCIHAIDSLPGIHHHTIPLSGRCFTFQQTSSVLIKNPLSENRFTHSNNGRRQMSSRDFLRKADILSSLDMSVLIGLMGISLSVSSETERFFI